MYVLIEKILLQPRCNGRYHEIFADLVFEGCAPTSFEQEINRLGHVNFMIVSQDGNRARAELSIVYGDHNGVPGAFLLPRIPVRLSEAVAG